MKLHLSYSQKETTKGNTAMRHMQTAGHDMPCVTMSLHAVTAINPPTVRFALHRLKSPFVLNASVMSNALMRSR